MTTDTPTTDTPTTGDRGVQRRPDAAARRALQQLLDRCADAGTGPSVLALARQLGMTNPTFRRQHPDLVEEISRARRPGPAGRQPTTTDAEQRLQARNSQLRRANRDLTDQLRLAAAQIQHLAMEGARLRAAVESRAEVTRLAVRR